jgi:hypothetical protein
LFCCLAPDGQSDFLKDRWRPKLPIGPIPDASSQAARGLIARVKRTQSDRPDDVGFWPEGDMRIG